MDEYKKYLSEWLEEKISESYKKVEGQDLLYDEEGFYQNGMIYAYTNVLNKLSEDEIPF